MTERVREILSWYGGDNPGTLTSLTRLMNHGALAGTGKMVILPVDQGFEHGPARSFAPNPAAYDPRYRSIPAKRVRLLNDLAATGHGLGSSRFRPARAGSATSRSSPRAQGSARRS